MHIKKFPLAVCFKLVSCPTELREYFEMTSLEYTSSLLQIERRGPGTGQANSLLTEEAMPLPTPTRPAVGYCGRRN